MEIYAVLFFFAPNDDIRKALLFFISQEQKGIRIAIFNVTDREITKALIQAQKQGIRIELITDPSCLHHRYNKIDQLAHNNITVRIYNQKDKGVSSLMHHKFALFERNINNKALVWTGSSNFTRSGCCSNQENVIVTDDRHIVSQYLRQFNRIKQETKQYYIPPAFTS